jgi:hypothetical protein
MHACLLHIYNHAFTLFVLIIIYPQKSVMITCEQHYLNKDRSFVMLTSCIRLYPVSSKFHVLSNYFLSLVSFKKIDWHASDTARVLSQLRSACCVLGARC